MIDIKRYGMDKLEDEIIPETPPHPGMLSLEEDENARKKVYNETYVPGNLAYELVRSAYRLMELSKKRQGNYAKGFEIPESCRAASIGAIVVSCAAFEALLNELMIEVESLSARGIDEAKCKQIGLSMGLSPDKRFETISAVFGKCINWGEKPYQSLNYLLSVRKHLLHHETKMVLASDGFWPSKKLKELARIICTPYPLDCDPPLHWDQHILTPNGAEWALEVLSDIIIEIEEIEAELRKTIPTNI